MVLRVARKKSIEHVDRKKKSSADQIVYNIPAGYCLCIIHVYLYSLHRWDVNHINDVTASVVKIVKKFRVLVTSWEVIWSKRKVK